MPCFRGIELSVVTASDDSVLPEFPHPDGSSARFGGSGARRRHSGTVFLSPGPPKKQGTGRLGDDDTTTTTRRDADPTISVYIPSVPESNFYFRYAITQRPADHKYLCFRVVINGQTVVSWGVDVDVDVDKTTTTTGAVHQALFQPSSAQFQRCVDGVLMTQHGIESRGFRFVTCGAAQASVADDGGLIEVQAFRARARRRRAPQPDRYRGRARYGIALVTNGLLEQPETASYYDYHLVDANDSPYASFRFHYRSWASLWALQLAPAQKLSVCCSPPSKALSKTFRRPPEMPAAVAAEATDKDSIATPGVQTSHTRRRPLPQLPTVSRRTKSMSTSRHAIAGSGGPNKPLADAIESSSSSSSSPTPFDLERPCLGYSLQHVAPFTDDLCKRRVVDVCSSGTPRLRGISSDLSPRRQDRSPVARRLYEYAASL